MIVLCSVCALSSVVLIVLLGLTRASTTHAVSPQATILPATIASSGNRGCVGPANLPASETIAATLPAAAQSPVPVSLCATPNATVGIQTLAYVGIPAITPRSGATDSATPAFTADDVRQYLTTHQIGGKIGSSGPISVVSVPFMTAKEAQSLLGITLSPLPPDELVCLATMTGSFTVAGPAISKKPASGTATTEYVVFDAHSGNVVVQNVR